MYRDFYAVQHIIGSLLLPSAGAHSAAAFMLKRPVCETTDPAPVLRAGAGAQSGCAPCCLSLHLGAEGTRKVRSAVGISLCASPPR